MSFEVAGKLIKKYEIENKTGTFQAREFVIEVTEGRYPEYVKFQLTQERCGLIDPYNEGDWVKVSFDLRGREWQGKYFTNLNAWRVEKAEAAAPTAQPNYVAPPQTGFPAAADEPPGAEFGDDLPF